jgi:hypothetical protein
MAVMSFVLVDCWLDLRKKATEKLVPGLEKRKEQQLLEMLLVITKEKVAATNEELV